MKTSCWHAMECISSSLHVIHLMFFNRYGTLRWFRIPKCTTCVGNQFNTLFLCLIDHLSLKLFLLKETHLLTFCTFTSKILYITKYACSRQLCQGENFHVKVSVGSDFTFRLTLISLIMNYKDLNNQESKCWPHALIRRLNVSVCL